MVHILDVQPANDVRKHLQVDDIATGRVDVPGDDDLQDVIAPVEVRALSEEALVLGVRQARSHS
jgi:hypothetical protein